MYNISIPLFMFFYRQRQCKPNAMKFSSIAEVQPVFGGKIKIASTKESAT